MFYVNEERIVNTDRVTRMEILDAVEDVFGPSGAAKADIIDRAECYGARPALIEVLARLDEAGRCATVRNLWKDLPDVPIE
ncbi:hypothetical protein [Pseudonocardia sp. MH-G8]|uniref:hypothetical protein n=1 Tax=Pseudonocardia sp. MH-G8 TaxID=1854588 RepID=UPI000BA0065E|nr:hypothetical protein [Pseudonocardia sp. MH-G8]OZM76600.1 hypothetical protein CFP66_40650 [Pseudonocardia sp. MH-G8]